MKYIYIVCAAILGAIQILMLRQITIRITGIRQGSVLPFIIAKLLIYAAMAGVTVFCIRSYALYVGVGFAAGFMLMLALILLIQKKHE